MNSGRTADRTTSVAVVGAGAVGMVLAMGLARAGVRTDLVGLRNAPRPGRTVALLAGSVRLLERLGIWDELAGHAAPLAKLRIVDGTDSLFRPAPVQFEAAELGHPAFGYNVPNDDLDRVLAAAAARTPDLGFVPDRVTGYRFDDDGATIETERHGSLRADLIVAADGRQSLARKAARIGTRGRDWPQVALTAFFKHDAPHGDTSVEFHTREGPCTLVPLPPTAAAPFRSSLVWVMRPEQARRLRSAPDSFAKAVERQAERLFGRMTLESEIGAFPIATSTSARLTAPRLILTGEAAHALPPIGAQGLNLSFRDVAAVIDLVSVSHQRNSDPGSAELLSQYEEARAGDVSLRTLAVDLLNGSLLSRSSLGDLARGGGLAALARLRPLRRLVMRQGLLAEADDRLPRLTEAVPPRADLTRGRPIGDLPPPSHRRS